MKTRAGVPGRTGTPSRISCTGRGASARAPLGAFLLLVLGLLGGCQEECLRHSDCRAGWVCEADGLCDIPPVPPATDSDAATGDTPDAAPPDDAGAEDAGDDAGDGPADAGSDLDAFG
jgi:hypothetical protein